MIPTRDVFVSALRVSAATFTVIASSAAVTIIATSAFGVTRQTDAYLVALAIPTTAVATLSLAPSIAAIPVLVQERSLRGAVSEQILASTLVWGIVIALTPLLLLLALARGPAVAIVAPGFAAADRVLTSDLMLITIPAALLNATTVGLGAALKARQRFVVIALAPAIVNVVSAMVIWLWRDVGVFAWAFGYLGGSAAALGVVVVALASSGRHEWLSFAIHHPAARGLVATIAPFALITALGEISSSVVVRIIASQLAGGVITALSIALTLANIPVLVSAYALGTTLVPAFASYVAEDAQRVRNLLRRGVRLLAFVLAPAAALTFVLATPVIRIVFERGRFDAQATALTADALSIYLLSLMAQPFVVVAHRALLGHRATRTLLVVGVLETSCLALFTVVLGGTFGYRGIAAAYVLSVFANATFLTLATLRRFARTDVAGSIAHAVVLTGIASVGGAAALVVAGLLLPADSRALEAISVAGAAATGLVVYVLIAWLSPLPAVREIRDLFGAEIARARG